MPTKGDQQFKVTIQNNLVDCDLALHLHIDGELAQRAHLPAQKGSCILGIYRSSNSVLPFKFQELKLVGASALPRLFSFVKPIRSSFPIFCLLAEDPDVEDAPVVPPEMGTIELRAYRIRVARKVAHRPSAQYGLHRGHVSERSKKAGWHHVR